MHPAVGVRKRDEKGIGRLEAAEAVRGGARTGKQATGLPESKVQTAVINHSLSTSTSLRVQSNEIGSSDKEKGGQIRDNTEVRGVGGGQLALLGVPGESDPSPLLRTCQLLWRKGTKTVHPFQPQAFSQMYCFLGTEAERKTSAISFSF